MYFVSLDWIEQIFCFNDCVLDLCSMFDTKTEFVWFLLLVAWCTFKDEEIMMQMPEKECEFLISNVLDILSR